ncbi:MAG: STT3 domain-containing protein [Promethearchaeota archaeon]
MSKIIRSLRNFRDRTQASLTVKKSNILLFLALAIVIIVAIMIRLSPVVDGNYLIKAFDPWIQYYNANYLSEHSLFEYFNWHDFKSWFPEGFDRSSLRPGLTFTVVFIFQAFNFLGINVSLYDVCFYFPAFMGGLTVFAAYLLGKEVLDRKCGLFAAFFMAFNVGFMQRTTAGFFDNETIGVFATLMTFYFFIKTIKSGRIVHSLLGGLFLGYLALSWGGYDFVFLILPLIVGILILANKYETNVLIAYSGVTGVGLLIFSVYSTFDYGHLFRSLDVGGIFIFMILLIIFHLIYTNKTNYPKLYNTIINLLKWGLIPVIIVGAIIIWVAPNIIPFGFGTRIQSILSPLLRDQMHLVASVAEHMPSPWSVFYYNTLIPLMLLPLGIFFAFKRSDIADIFLIVFILLIFYFTSSMIRIILLFAPAASLIGAYGLVNVLKIFGSFYGEKRTSMSRKRKRQLKRMVGKSEIAAVYVIVGIMCMAQVMYSTNVSITQLSASQIAPGGVYHDWEETLTWMKTNLPGDTVVVSWWDYGYWITPIGNMTTVNDNATVNQTRIGLTGMALMQTNEIYSAKILRHLGADYVLVFFGYLINGLGGDEGKWPWMIRICNDNYQFYKSLGLEEDNWADNSVFDESEYYNDNPEVQAPEKKWFDSQLVKLMFYELPTAPFEGNAQTFGQYYQQQINTRTDADGNLWSTSIAPNGEYDFNVFQKAYFSNLGMVKLYKVDYTVLESSFSILEPEVFDNGYATFKLRNTGTKTLVITDVQINGQSFDFSLGKGIGTNILNASEEDLVWVDTEGSTFNKNDIAQITVEAAAEGLADSVYSFTNQTSNFFVKEGSLSKIQINKENSWVEQINSTTADVYLEVENVGENVAILDDFYANTEDNVFPTEEYLSGSSILQPGEKALVHLPNSIVDFNPANSPVPSHKIGVITPNGIKDEILLCSSYENFELTILNERRILSPEAFASGTGYFRKHIPIYLNETYAYTYDNGTTILNIRVKNTGTILLGMDSVYLKQASSNWTSVSFEYDQPYIDTEEELNITVVASDYFEFDVNDEIGVIVSASFDGPTKTADVGYVHTIRDQSDIQIIEDIEGSTVSMIRANETGTLLIKNTGDQTIELDEIIINETITIPIDTETEFLYGDLSLAVQESALISFNITSFPINVSDQVDIRVTTNSSAQATANLTATVDTTYYNINIDDSATYADIFLDKFEVNMTNNGLLNLTVNSVYINDTYIPLANFTFEDGANYSIITGNLYELQNSIGYITISISLTDLEVFLGLSIVAENKLEILVRTEEGAEDIHQETVV